ncbi:hypothetical protein WDU94_009940 [Cyamophila willieti]
MLDFTRSLSCTFLTILCVAKLIVLVAHPLDQDQVQYQMIAIEMNFDKLDQEVINSEVSFITANQTSANRVENSKDKGHITDPIEYQKGKIVQNRDLKDKPHHIRTNLRHEIFDFNLLNEYGDDGHKASVERVQKGAGVDNTIEHNMLREFTLNLGLGESFAENTDSLPQDSINSLEDQKTIFESVGSVVEGSKKKRRCYSDDNEGPSVSDGERDALLDDVINNPETYQQPQPYKQFQQAQPDQPFQQPQPDQPYQQFQQPQPYKQFQQPQPDQPFQQPQPDQPYQQFQQPQPYKQFQKPQPYQEPQQQEPARGVIKLVVISTQEPPARNIIRQRRQLDGMDMMPDDIQKKNPLKKLQ